MKRNKIIKKQRTRIEVQKRYGKRIIAWFLLVVMGINCFGGQIRPGVSKVQATDYETASEEVEATIRAAEEAAGIDAENKTEQIVEDELSVQTTGDNTETSEEKDITTEEATEGETEETTEEAIVYESMTISSATTLTEDMEVGDLTVNSSLNLNGYKLIVHGNLILNSALYMTEGCLIVEGNYQENYYAVLYMESFNDYIQIKGNYVYANSYCWNQNRNKGMIDVYGDLVGANGSYCSANIIFGNNCEIRMCGSTEQIIDIGTNSLLQIKKLGIENSSEEGVLSKHMLKCETLVDENNQLHYPCQGSEGMVLTEDTVIEGDFCLLEGELDLAGFQLDIQGDFIHAGGKVVVNGGSLNIQGDYKRMLTYAKDESKIEDYSVGRLIMQNEADYVFIGGNYIDCGLYGTASDLTAGIMEIQGNITARNGLTHPLLETTGTHTVKLTGNAIQLIETGSTYTGNNYRFAHFIIEQGEEGSVVWNGDLVVTGSVAHNSSNVTGRTRIEGAAIQSASIYGNVYVYSDYAFNTDVTIYGDLYMGYYYGSTITLAACHVVVKGNYYHTDVAFRKSGENFRFTVEKDMVVCNSRYGNDAITTGVFEIGGNIVQSGSAYIRFTDTSEVHFIGTEQQNINLSDTYCYFTNIVVDNPTGVVVSAGPAVENVTCIQGTLSYASGGVHGFTLEEDMVYEGDLTIAGGVLNLNGHSLHVKGNLTFTGGALNMTQGTDYLLVDGDFSTATNVNHNGKLTNGTLEVKGNFSQTTHNYAFAASGNHKVILSGETEQTVTFSNINYSYFCNVDFKNQERVILKNGLYASGVVDDQCVVEGWLYIKNTTSFPDGNYAGRIRVYDRVTLQQDWEISGDLYVNYNCSLYLNGYSLAVGGDIVLEGYARLDMTGSVTCQTFNACYTSYPYMTTEDSKLIVHNTMTIQTSYGKWTAGTILAEGDVTLTEDSYVPCSQALTLELSGTEKQTITMNSQRGTFGTVILNNTSEEGIYITKDFTYIELENKAGTKVTFANGGVLGYTLEEDTTIDGDFLMSGGIMDLNGHTLTVKGNLLQSGGTMKLNGGALVVEGDYAIAKWEKEEDGTYTYSATATTITMTKEEESITVKGDLHTYATLSITGGTFQIGKNWLSHSRFTGSNLTVILLGNINHVVYEWMDLKNSCTLYLNGETQQSFSDNADYICLDDVVINNTNGLKLARNLNIYGELTTNGYPIAGWINLYGTIKEDSIHGNVVFWNYENIYKDLYVDGSANLYYLDLKGYHLTIAGDCTFSNSSYGSNSQADGILEIKGNMVVGSNSNYYGSGTNKIILSGDKKQTIKKSNYAWHFNEIVITNTSEEGVYAEEFLQANVITDPNQKLSFPVEGDVGYKLTQDTVIQGDFTLLAGNMDLNGYQLTIMGDLTHRNGNIDVNQGTLIVKGNYTLGNLDSNGNYQKHSAKLIMNEEADNVQVEGDVLLSFCGNMASYLCNGKLEVKGDFSYDSHDAGYDTLGKNWHLLFSGKEKQKLTNLSQNDVIRLGTIDITNTSSEGVVATNYMWFQNPVNGSDKLHGTSGHRVVWATGHAPRFTTWEGILQLNTATVLENDLNVEGTLFANAALDVNGNHLVVDTMEVNNALKVNGGIVQVEKNLAHGNYYSSITMSTEDDILQITGNLNATYGSLYLTAGQLDIKGNVNINGASVTTGDTHTTTLSGKMTSKGSAYIQEVTLASGRTLNKLVLTKPRDYYVFNRDVEGMCKELVEDIQDITSPTTPLGVTVTEVSYTKATVSWNAASDDTGIAGYDIYRNDKKMISVSGTSYTDKNLQPGTEYTYYVVAKDATMNTSASSKEVTITTLEDDVAPNVPKQPVLTQRMGSALTFTWEPATDNVKTTKYLVYRDGEEIGTTSRTEYMDKELQKNQSYTYTIVAMDAAGNASQPSEEVTFYTQAVEIASVTPANYTKLSGSAPTIRVDFQNAGSTEGYQVYIGYREDDQQTEHAEYTELYSKRVGSGTAYRKALYAEATLDVASIESESIEVLIRITDAGGYEVSETYTYTMDKSAPSKLESFGGEVEDGVAVVSYAKGTEVDIAGYYIYRQTGEEEKALLADITDKNKTYYYDKTIEEGVTYTYFVAAYDEEGHIGELSDGVVLTGNADTSLPVIESVEPVDGILHGQATLTVKARDNKALDKLIVEMFHPETETYEAGTEYAMENGSTTCTIDTTQYVGEVTLRLTVLDKAGNQNETEYIKTYTIDNEGPGQILNLKAKQTSTTAVLSWDAPTDSDFSYFLLEEKQEDDTWKELGRTTTVTGYALEGLLPQSVHTYRVTGVDIYENKGIPSEELTITVGEDTIAPRILGVSPNGGYYGTSLPLTIRTYDNIALQEIIVEYSTDKETWNNITTVSLENTPKEYTLQHTASLEELPEGNLYIRAYAKDVAGNMGDVEQICIQYVIDRTAPSVVSNFTARGEAGSIGLSWSEPIENDVAAYRIYRSVEGLHSYKVLADHVTTLGYYDRSAAYDVSYTYRISAIDKAGNESELSDVVIAQKLPDDTKPVVHSLIPAKDTWISGACELSAYVSDNDHVTSVEFAIIENQTEEDETATEVATKMVLDTVTTDTAGGTVTSQFDTTDFANGVYQLLVTATDASGNVSETYTSLCHIANISLPTPELFAEAGDWCVNLHYSGNLDETYILYKKKATEDTYSVLKTGVGILSYVDYEVNPDYQYEYRLMVEDKAGNRAESMVMRVKPNPVDTKKPTVVLYGDTSIVEDYETIFYGSESTDNHKIVSYAWDFGDGTTGSGPTPVHAYKEAGDYNVTLTVTDASGNVADKTIRVTVLPKESAGKALVEVRNAAGTPLSGVTVFVNTSSEKNDEHFTNASGIATIRQKPGTYRVALYKPGYVATEVLVEVELHGERSYVFTLQEGETVSADFTVRQMTFEEIVEAGIDISDPANQHVFTVQTKLSFTEATRTEDHPITTPGLGSTCIVDNSSSGGASSDEEKEEEKPQPKPPLTPEEKEEAETTINECFYHTIYITQSISWLKDMYEATLVVYNNASSQSIVATDLSATVTHPSGVSFAGTKNGQNETQKIPDIRGGETQAVSWYFRGDTPGTYKLNATLNGTLNPFGAQFVSNFESNEFDVTAGDGLVLTIEPEDRAEQGEEYYVYFTLSNEGGKEFYNVKTTFGTQKNNSKRYIASTSGNKGLPVMSAGDMVAVDCLKPGESISGIYKTILPVEGEKYKNYLELVAAECKVLQGSNLGVSVRISETSSHVPIPEQIYPENTDENSEADPVNVSTGAYTDAISALSIQGVNPVSASLQYDSTAIKELGEFGYGWTHNYEARILDMKDGTVRYYVSPSGYYTFLAEDYENAEYKQDSEGYLYLDLDSIPAKQNFKCLNETQAGYVLKRLDDKSFKLTDAAGNITLFNKDGQITSLKNKEGKEVVIERQDDCFHVTDKVSERSLTYYFNGDKLVERVEDSGGREVFFYYDENQCLKQFTNALGENTYYTYDEKHRLLTVTDDNANTYVSNVYDEENRVILQKDAKKNETKFSYEVDKQSGDTATYVTTRSGRTKKTVTDAYGNVTLSVNEAGDRTETTYDLNGNQTAVNNANGYSVVYRYDSDNNMTAIENSLMDGDIAETTMTYDGDGNMLSMENSNGESMRCTYNDKGLIETVTDQNNNTTTYAYNEYGQIAKETDSDGNTVEYTYNAKGDLTAVKDKNGNVTEYSYNQFGLQEKTAVQAGGETYTTQTFYDDMGRVDYTIDTEGGVTSYEYDCAGNITCRIDPAGAMTVFQYDKNYQLIKETVYSSEAEGEVSTSSTTYTYTKEGLLKTVTDGVSQTKITNTYDEVGNKIREVETNKDGKELSRTVCEYDKAGNLTKQTVVNVTAKASEANTLSVAYKYYPNGKLNYAVDTAGNKTTYSYDDSWRVETVQSDTSPTLHYTYDAAGRVKTETVGSGKEAQTVSYDYDIFGNVTSVTDNKNIKTLYRYDANGNLIETEDATGKVYYSKYDALNRVVESGVRKPGTTENIPLTAVSYNISKHTVTETDVVHGGSIITHYDEAGRPYKSTNAKGYVLSETIYDTEGRTLQSVDANGLVTEYVYNNLMQISSVKTGAKGSKNADGTYTLSGEIRETSYSYDDLGRNTQVTEFLEGVDDNGNKKTEPVISSVVYDGLGRIQSLKDPNQNQNEADNKPSVNTYEYTYYDNGFLQKEVNAIGNVMEYSYNAQMLLETVKDSAGEETTYTYDSLNRIERIKDECGYITYVYDENNNIEEVIESSNLAQAMLNSGKRIKREYDSLNRITSYKDYKDREIKYSYDDMGYLDTMTYPSGQEVSYDYYDDGLMKTMTFVSSSGGTGYTWEYRYDAYGRLQNIKRPDGTEEERIYDEAGKLKSQKDIFKKDNKETIVQQNDYTYNVFGEIITKTTSQTGNVDKLESVKMTYNDANRLETYNGQKVTYDAKGNMTNGPVNGDMTTLTYDSRNRLTSAGGVTYSYDAENNRISSTENGLITEYVTDSSGSLSQLLVAYEPDNTRTLYVYGAEGLAGQYNTGTGERLYYHFDNIGSTTCVTDQAGAVVEAFTYGTYGELLTQVKNNIRFLYNGSYGVMTDSNGLYYMRARYYNPDIKRFINQDIKVGDISNGQSLNRYAYCEGNPVSLIDPFGLSPEASQDQVKESKFQWLHTTLDVVGLFWDGADVINVAVYAMEGNAVQAGISLACALPFIGNVVAGVAKGTKLAKMGNLIGKTLRTAGKMYMTTTAATTALDLAGDAKLEEAANGGKPSVSSMVKKAGALFLGAVAAANGGSLTDEIQGLTKAMDTVMNTSNRINADAMSGKCGKGDGIGCFIAGTKVKTAEGDCNIEDVEVGDYVLAENVETGEQEYKQVTETFTYEKTKLVHVYVGDEEIETTVEHPFYVEGLGFVSAGELQAGDIIRTSDGRKLPIKKVEIEELEGTVTVYNFEVEEFHTYYVSELGVLVHNVCEKKIDETVQKYGGTIIDRTTTRKGQLKKDYLFKNKSDAKNFARSILGDSAYRTYNEKGKWVGWESEIGKVYWGHGDWGKNQGKSTFPHLNYQIGELEGHLFLENKIKNRGQFLEFLNSDELWRGLDID